MSVNKGKRKTQKSKLQVLVMTKGLASYTIRICKNQKVFLVECNTAITNDIVHIATMIHVYAWNANNIKVKNAEQANQRRNLQNKAVVLCNNLLPLIQIAQEVFHLKTKRVKFWSKKVIAVREMLKKWRDADRRRYQKNNIGL